MAPYIQNVFNSGIMAFFFTFIVSFSISRQNIFVVVLKYFLRLKNFARFFYIIEYDEPLLEYFTSTFLLLSKSYQLMLSDIFL